MRVLIAAPVYPLPADSGARIRLMRHLSLLASRHEVMTVTVVRGDEPAEADRQLESLGSLVRVPAPHRKSPLHRVGYKAGYTALGALRAWPPDAFYGCPGPFARQVIRSAREWNADIVHYDYWFSAIHDRGPQPYLRVLLEHDVEYVRRRRDAEHSEPGSRGRLAALAERTERLEKRVLRLADCVLTVTDRDAEEALSAGAKKAVTLPTGVDTDAWQPPEAEPAAKNLVFVGAFSHNPNVDAMLWFADEIFPEVLRGHPDAKLVVVGSAPTPEIEALSAREGITVTGRVPDVAPYYRMARVVLAPLRIGSGIKGKIIEGMAFGRPVVTTPVGAEGMGLTDGGNVVIADGAQSFASAVSTLLQDQKRARELGMQARRFAVEHHSHKKADERILEIYEKDIWEVASLAATQRRAG